MLCVLLRNQLNGGLQVEPAPGEKALSFLLAGFASRNARNDRIDRRLTLWPSASARCRGSKGFLLHPVRIPIERKRTRRRLLSSRHVSVPHTLARAFKSGALPAWPTCRTGGNQRTVWPQIF